MNIDDITPVSDLASAAQPALAVIESAAESVDFSALAESLGDVANTANDAIVEIATVSGSITRRAGRQAARAASTVGRAAAKRPALTASVTAALVGAAAFAIWRSRQSEPSEAVQPTLMAA